MKWYEKVYALYVGRDNVCDGTIPQIAELTGRSIASLKWMTTPTGIRRINNRVKENPTMLVPIKDEDTPIGKLKLSGVAMDALLDVDIMTVKDLVEMSDKDFEQVHSKVKVRNEIAGYRDWFKEEDEEIEQAGAS